MWDSKDIERDFEQMKQARLPFESMMKEAAIWFLPRHQQFNALHQFGEGFKGPQQDHRIFDPHAQQSLDQAVSLFEGYVIPQGQIWQRWQLPDEDLMKLQHVRQWVERKNMVLFKLCNDPKSGFTGQSHESIASLLAMGTQSMWPDIRRNLMGEPEGLSYTSDFIGQVYVKTNWQGLVDTVFFSFTLTARQAEGRWKSEAPEPVKKAMRDKQPDKHIQFLHCVAPNSSYDPGMIDWRGKPWAGCFYCCDNKEVFKTGGYRQMPRIVSRYMTAPNEDYGRSPAFTVLPAVRASEQMVQDIMLASELNAMPPLAAHSDMFDQTVKYAAHEITYGAIDHRGNRRLVPLLEGADTRESREMLMHLRGLIDRAFFVDLLAIRQDLKSHVTDSQLYQREEEKGILLAPLANQATEWFSVMLDREIDLMDEMGLLDDMPGEVEDALDAGMPLMEVSYDNGLTRAQESGAAAGYFRLLEQFTPIFQSDDEAWQLFKAKWPLEKVLDNLGRINAVPAAWEADEDARMAAEQRAGQRQEMADLIAALPAIGKTAKDLSDAVPANAA